MIITKDDLAKYKTDLVNFYDRYFPKESNKIMAKNCPVFFVAIRNNELIGACRLLTDFSRYALLLDLIVRKTERNKGIGKNLVKQVTSYCKDQKIHHLILTTDSRVAWLTDFYQKLGFQVVSNQSLMEFSA